MAEHVWRDERYNRQIAVPIFGESGQAALSNSSVVVIGAGGVKSTLLLHLAAMGVGRIRVIDADRVELSNLNRQVLYTMDDIGKYKAECAVAAMARINPDIALEARVEVARPETYDRLLGGFDLVVEGGSSQENRLQFNRWAVANEKTYIHASAHYNYCYAFTVIPGLTACFECFYGDIDPTPSGPVPVLGAATAMAGSIAVSEVLNLLLGRAPTLAGSMWAHQGWTNRTIVTQLGRRNDCEACKSVPVANRSPEMLQAR